MRVRSDSIARSICGSTINPNSQMTAGASSNSKASRVRGAARSTVTAAFMCRWRETEHALGVEAEEHDFLLAQIGEATRLRQRDPELGVGVLLAHEHCRVRAIEQ